MVLGARRQLIFDAVQLSDLARFLEYNHDFIQKYELRAQVGAFLVLETVNDFLHRNVMA